MQSLLLSDKLLHFDTACSWCCMYLKATGYSSHCLSALSIAFLNDSFAATFSERVTRTIRKFSPHLAAKMRPPHMPVLRGRPSAKKSTYIFGRPRLLFVLLFSAASFVLWYTSGSLLYVSWALITGLLVLALHASFKTPNLKARLNTFREEFREVWRNYSDL
ncbi:prenylated rab acceptor family protein [Salix suchowensis]|nr:prenylated rab acceptor family protein [Salix suchowensis]